MKNVWNYNAFRLLFIVLQKRQQKLKQICPAK